MSVHTQAHRSAEPLSSDISARKPVTIATLQRKKVKGDKIISLTCYDYSMARILDRAGVDLLLVGDSLAMTMLGHANTLSVTVDEMLHHVKAVARGAKTALLVADMPFMSYQVEHAEAIRHAGRFIQEGQAQAVKLEGASERVLNVVRHLVEMGIPVMGHLGFTPQSVHTLGGFKVQGKTLADAENLLREALQLQAAGVFALVLEMVPVEVASLISRRLDIPTIGIGAGNGCDGQVLVIDDLLGRYSDFMPRFVRRYLDSGSLIGQAVANYGQDVQSGAFPSNEMEAFAFPPERLPELVERLTQLML